MLSASVEHHSRNTLARHMFQHSITRILVPREDITRHHKGLLGGVLFFIMLLGCSQPNSTKDPKQLLSNLELSDKAVEQLLFNLTARLDHDLDNGDSWGELAIAYEANGYRTTSLTCYQEARNRNPSNPRWFYLPAVLLSQQGDLINALELMIRAMELQKDYGPGYVWLGQWLLELNRIDEAAQAFQDAKELNVGPIAELGLAQVMLRESQPQSALDLLDSILKSYPHPQVHRLRSNALRDLNRTAEAEQAANLATENVTVWWSDPILDSRQKYTVGFNAKLSVVEDLVKQRRMSDALLVIDELHLTNPDDLSLLYQSALVDFQLNDLESATYHLLRAIEIDESHYPSRLLLAEIYRSQLKLPLSIEQLQRVIAIHPSLSSPHERLAMIYIHQDNHEAALASIKRAIELDAKEKEVFYYAGVLEGSRGEWQNAIDYFEKAIRVEPHYAQAFVGLAQCYGELRELSSARRNLDEARSLGLAEQEYQKIKTWLDEIES